MDGKDIVVTITLLIPVGIATWACALGLLIRIIKDAFGNNN